MRSDCVKIQNPKSRRGAYGWAENLWIQDPESRAWVGGQCMRAGVKITDPRSRGLPCSEGEQGGVKITDPESKSGLEREEEDRTERK